jgi:hypothetical protein
LLSYVLDAQGIIATAPDFHGVIAEVGQAIAEKSRRNDFSTEMTPFIADFPQRRELVMLGEFSSHCSITPSEYLVVTSSPPAASPQTLRILLALLDVLFHLAIAQVPLAGSAARRLVDLQ